MSGKEVPLTSDVTLLANADSVPAQDRPPLPLLENQWGTWTDYAPIHDALTHSNISAPGEYREGLQHVVDAAAHKGIDLKIVITEERGYSYPQARDLATRISLEHPESTIFVRTPAYIGSYSNTVPRARLEAAQDDAYREGDPVVSATLFENHIVRPPVPWAAYAGAVIVVVVLAAAIFAYLIRRRAQRTP